MIRLTLEQAEEIVDFLGGDHSTVVCVDNLDDGHSGPGLYVWIDTHEEEGATFLGVEE